MAYENEKQTQAPEQVKKQRPAEQLVPKQGFYRIPNSVIIITGVLPTHPTVNPNSGMREMPARQIPDTEADPERLSQRIRYGTPNSVRRQTYTRPGFDFFPTKFHNNSENICRNKFMHIRAYTRGRDIYFCSGIPYPASESAGNSCTSWYQVLRTS